MENSSSCDDNPQSGTPGVAPFAPHKLLAVGTMREKDPNRSCSEEEPLIGLSKKRKRRVGTGIPVLRVDKQTGEVLEEYESAAEASRCTGILQGNIGHVLRGRRKTAGGFVFQYKFEEDRLLRRRSSKVADDASTTPTPVLKMDSVTGIVLDEYPSAEAAARSIGVTRDQFCNIVKPSGEVKELKGFLFRYKSTKNQKKNAPKKKLTKPTSKPGPRRKRKQAERDKDKDFTINLERKSFTDMKTPGTVLRVQMETGEVFEEYASMGYAARAMGMTTSELQTIVESGEPFKGFCFRFKFNQEGSERLSNPPAEGGFSEYTSLRPMFITDYHPPPLVQRRTTNGLLVPLEMDDLLRDFLPGSDSLPRPSRSDTFMANVDEYLTRHRRAIQSHPQRKERRPIKALTPKDVAFY